MLIVLLIVSMWINTYCYHNSGQIFLGLRRKLFHPWHFILHTSGCHCKNRMKNMKNINYSKLEPKTYSTSSIVSVSMIEKIKFYGLAIFWGLAALLKLGALWLWNSKKYFVTKRRDRPPRCLVDSLLGHHSYIKLKVNSEAQIFILNLLITLLLLLYV